MGAVIIICGVAIIFLAIGILIGYFLGRRSVPVIEVKTKRVK